MVKVKAKYKLKIKIKIDGKEIALPFETDLDSVADDVTAVLVDHMRQEYAQKKSGAVLDASVVTGVSEKTVWRRLRRFKWGKEEN